ncbi:MAG: hypothetical protein Q7V19_06265, partial [Bacteroidales bacterium]|nr:hypothetical protein [Bacteroidales bacterium]
MKKSAILTILIVIFVVIKTNSQQMERLKPVISETTISQVIDDSKKSADSDQHDRIEKGVRQVASFWQVVDGDEQVFSELCRQYSVKNAVEKKAVFDRLENNLELLLGSFNKMNVGLKIPLHVDEGEILAIDRIFGGYSPGAHISDDFFANKLAFITILNFPFYSLNEKTAMGEDWTRLEWAYARMGDVFKSRVPANLLQNYSQIVTDADGYISDYNIYMGKLIDKKGKSIFPADMKLISHWGLRDEIKANYASKTGFAKQAIIYEVMQHIVRQDIPKNVINNPNLEWNPFTNMVYDAGKPIESEKEPNT